jgi:hypothetical protein
LPKNKIPQNWLRLSLIKYFKRLKFNDLEEFSPRNERKDYRFELLKSQEKINQEAVVRNILNENNHLHKTSCC